MVRSRLVVAALTVCTLGCDAIWNAANRGTAEADLRSIFEQNRLLLEVGRCRMIGTTRDAICEVRAGPDDVSNAVRRLGLQPLSANRGLPATAPELCAEASRFVAGEAVLAYGAAGRPSILVLGHGAALESMYLFYDPATRRGCVRISYSYG